MKLDAAASPPPLPLADYDALIASVSDLRARTTALPVHALVVLQTNATARLCFSRSSWIEEAFDGFNFFVVSGFSRTHHGPPEGGHYGK